jgi:hypothetical protein
MSKIAEDVFLILQTEFPFTHITKEYFVNFKNTRLLFDFYIRSMNLLFECQGKQHFTFTKHFHSSKEEFYGQKRRDNLKLEYCEDSGLTLVFLYDKIDIITTDLVLERIYEAMNG